MTAIPGDRAHPGQPPIWCEGDVLILRISGTMGGAEMQRTIAMGEELFVRHGYILILVDAIHTTGLSADARKLNADRMKEFIRPSHTALYNVNTMLRLISTMAQRGTELITGKTYPITFHKDESEARAELASQRMILRRAAGSPG
jgi:hypothetical protein